MVLPSACHTKDDIRGAATKILIDVQKQTKNIVLTDLESLPEKVRESVWEKLSETLMLITEPKPEAALSKLNVVNLEMTIENKEPAP